MPDRLKLLPDPIELIDLIETDELIALAGALAPQEGYNPTPLQGLRILRSSCDLDDVPVLYRPGAVFVLQGAKRGFLGSESFVYDARHYLAVSLPVPFRMESRATSARPLLAIYMDFDLGVAAELADFLAREGSQWLARPRGLVSSPMERRLVGALARLLEALGDPAETAALGASLLREIHFRVLTGAQGGALVSALRQGGPAAGIQRSLSHIRRHYGQHISVHALASEAGMSIAAFHVRFRDLTGMTPLTYVKSVRLHQARLLMARDEHSVAAAAAAVGYVSASQFSREFKRHFGRTASDEIRWMRAHLGELAHPLDERAVET
jgi:AraC-like DNA-binding protein